MIKENSSGILEYCTVVLGSVITIVLGTWIPLMTTLLVLNATDILTGVMKGGVKHSIGSRQFYAGLKKKGGHWILIIVANAIDTMAFDNMPIAKTGMVSFLIGTEGISITENVAILGVPVPKFITKYLIQIRDVNDDMHKEFKS